MPRAAQRRRPQEGPQNSTAAHVAAASSRDTYGPSSIVVEQGYLARTEDRLSKQLGHVRASGRTVSRILLVSVVGLLASVGVAAPAAAQDGDLRLDDQDRVVLTGGLRVIEGETVTTAVVFNGPVVIDGTVTESLVVFNGRTEISGTVRNDVVVFNGRVVIRAGAEIGGDVASRQTPQIEDGATVSGAVQDITNRFDFENLGLAGRTAWWIGYSVSTLILGLLMLLFAPALDVAIVDALRRRTGAAVGFGVAAFILIPIAAALLLVTIVGIPLGLFVLLGLALLYTVGYVVGAHALGRLLVKPPTSRFLAFLAGLGIVRLLGLIPFVGGLVWLLAAIFGLGLLAVAARRRPPVAAPVTRPSPAPAIPPGP